VIERTFQIDGIPEISIRIQSGRVELAEGVEGVVKVNAVTKDPDLVIEQHGDLIDIYSEAEGWTRSKRVEIVAKVPPGCNATIRTASADVECAVELEKLEIKTASGDIEVDSAEKAIIKTASGDTTIGAAGNALRFNSASGDLRVRKVAHGSVVVSTASGDVHIDETDAVVEINTVSGDSILDRFVGKSAAIKTMSGSIELGIPSGTKVDLDVSLLSGKVHLPPKTEAAATDRRMSLKVKSVSGDLTINRIGG
jgi:predicted membrane protein